MSWGDARYAEVAGTMIGRADDQYARLSAAALEAVGYEDGPGDAEAAIRGLRETAAKMPGSFSRGDWPTGVEVGYEDDPVVVVPVGETGMVTLTLPSIPPDEARIVFAEQSDTQRNDDVEHPAHYTAHPSGVECLEITRHFDFCTGNAIKYLWRAGLKGGAEKRLEDLRKARFYVNDLIRQAEQ